MKWESAESIYGIDNNRESAALLFDETGGTKSRQPRPGSRGAEFQGESTRARSNPVDSWIPPVEHFSGHAGLIVYVCAPLSHNALPCYSHHKAN